MTPDIQTCPIPLDPNLYETVANGYGYAIRNLACQHAWAISKKISPAGVREAERLILQHACGRKGA